MKKYSLSLRTDQLDSLRSELEREDGNEGAVYVFCNVSKTATETRLIVKEIQAIDEDHVIERSASRIRIVSDSFVQAMAKADRESKSLVFIHSHPGGFNEYSDIDDQEEAEFFRTAYIRAPQGLHASALYIGEGPDNIIGRVWLKSGTHRPLSRIRVIGKRAQFFDSIQRVGIPAWASRQVLAFGPEMQKLLKTLSIGVVGAGGTGSSVTEQLIRLGVGHITTVDEQDFENTNVNRLYGSRLSDADQPTPKVDVMERLANNVGLGTRVTKIKGSVCDAETIKQLRDCDFVFGCTDDFLGRMMLNRLVYWYYIPVIDSAVLVDSEKGKIKEIIGRVTVLLPGSACLSCRRRISSERIMAQSKKRDSPDEYKDMVNAGYIPELGIPDPSVIMFTTGIASRAIAEFINILSGYMGDERTATELVERFHIPEVRQNSVEGDSGCICTSPNKWGDADQIHFLGLL